MKDRGKKYKFWISAQQNKTAQEGEMAPIFCDYGIVILYGVANAKMRV